MPSRRESTPDPRSRRTVLTALGAALAGVAGCNGRTGTDPGKTGRGSTDDAQSATSTRPSTATPTATPEPTPAPDPRLAWSRSFGVEVGAPRVADGLAAFVTWGEQPAVHVVAAGTGAVRWRRSFAAAPRELRWAGGDLYVGPGTPDRDDPAGRLHRYAPDGRQVWTTVRAERLPETDGPWSHNGLAPLGADGERVYATTRRYDDDLGEGIEGLYAFDRATGSLVWSRPAPSLVRHAHRLEESVVVVGRLGPELQSVAPGDGRLRWDRRGTVHDVDPGAGLALQDAHGEPGPLHVVDLRTGRSRISVAPPADWTEDWYGIRGVLVPDADRFVWWTVRRGSTYLAATGLDDGTGLWSRRDDLDPFRVTVVDGTVVVAEVPPEDGGNWALWGVDVGTGDRRWRRPFPDAYRLGYAGAADGAVAVEARLAGVLTEWDPVEDGERPGVRGDGGTGTGGDGTPDRVAVLDVTDGTTRWERGFADWTETWAVAAGGRLYAGETAVGRDHEPVAGRLRAFALDGTD